MDVMNLSVHDTLVPDSMHMCMSKAKLVNRFPDEGIGNRVCLFKPAIDSPRLSHLSAFFIPFLAEESWNDFPWQVLHRKRVDTDLVLERTAYAENRRVWALCERRKARINGKLSILLLGTFVPYFSWYDYVVNAVLSLSRQRTSLIECASSGCND